MAQSMIRVPKNFNRYPQAVLVVAAVVVLGYFIVRAKAASVVGDLNNDGVVNITDLSILLSHWSTNNATADINHDGTVNVLDLSMLLSHWGQVSSTPTPTPTPTPIGTPVSQSCTTPSHVIPMDPNNAQTGVSIGNFYITNDTWNASSYPGLQQTLNVCDYNNWYATATMNNNSGDGAVKTYPNVHQDFNEPLISSFHTISSNFAETGPHVGIYEYAYDMWLNGVASGGSTEVMIWNDNFNQTPGGSKVATFSDGGQSYNVFRSGSYIAFVDTTNVTSGTVNILDFYNFIISKGWIVSTSTIGQIDYGVELVSTNNQPATFQVNNFSLTAN